MVWLGGINPSSVNGPDPRKLRTARDVKREQPKVNAVSPADPAEPVDEFEPSIEARAVREEIEHAASLHAGRSKGDESGHGAADGESEPPHEPEREPPRPRLDLRG